MSNTETPPEKAANSSAASGADRTTEDSSRDELDARIDLLEEENRRLREEHTRVRQVQHRRTAALLAVLGLVSAGAGVLFPDAREVLFALGGTGLFAAILTLWITPERFVSVDVGERVYSALVDNQTSVIAELGLAGTPVYVPRDSDVRLYVSHHEAGEIPSDGALDDVFVVGQSESERGVSLTPTGLRLAEAIADSQTGSDVATAATTAANALVEQFEIADGVDVEVDRAEGRVSVEVAGPLYGDPERFDHPVASVLAVTLAEALDRPVRTDVAADPFVVTCRWDTDQ